MDGNKKVTIQFIILLFAIFMIVVGFSRGEVTIVWNKAINVCLECIGLG